MLPRALGLTASWCILKRVIGFMVMRTTATRHRPVFRMMGSKRYAYHCCVAEGSGWAMLYGGVFECPFSCALLGRTIVSLCFWGQ